MKKTSQLNSYEKYKLVNFIPHLYERNVLTERDKCDDLRDFVPFVQFKKREKHAWRSVNFSKVAGFSSCGCLLSQLSYYLRGKETGEF